MTGATRAPELHLHERAAFCDAYGKRRTAVEPGLHPKRAMSSLSRAWRVSNRRTLVLALGFIGFTSGCPAVAPVAKTATKSAIRGTYDEIDAIDPAQQERVIRKLLDSPAVHDAAHDLAASIVAGTADGLTETVRERKLDSFVNASLEAMRKGGDSALDERIGRASDQLSPVLSTLIHELVASTLAAFRDAAARDLPVIMSAVLDSTVRSLAIAAQGTSQQVREQAKSFAENDLGPIAGALSQQIAREAIVGVREGMHRELSVGGGTVQEEMSTVGMGLAQGMAKGMPASPFTTAFAVATFVLATLLLVALGVIVALVSRSRANSRVLSLLAEKLGGHDEPPASGPVTSSRLSRHSQ